MEGEGGRKNERPLASLTLGSLNVTLEGHSLGTRIRRLFGFSLNILRIMRKLWPYISLVRASPLRLKTEEVDEKEEVEWRGRDKYERKVSSLYLSRNSKTPSPPRHKIKQSRNITLKNP